MRRFMAILSALMLLLMGLSHANANSVGIDIAGITDSEGFDPIFAFIMGVANFTLPADPTNAEYSEDGDSVQVTFEDAGAQSSSLGSPGTASVALASMGTVLPFDSFLVTVQNDVTLPDGTLIGDAISVSALGGTGTYEGTLIRQLSFNLRDSTGTMIDNAGLDQLVGLELTDFTSAQLNILTPSSIILGTVTSYSATLIPIPASFWLFGSGLGLLGWLKRRAV
ncbi:MAG: hypothetical protein QNJ73_07555 [Gammaproteobacteria bacterium]|nr:hypothetical protein [Gammaproteobacteria bacterium]